MSTSIDSRASLQAAYERLSAEQQDHLFYALDWARSAGRDYYEIEFGVPAPIEFELALAEAYAEGLLGDTLDAIGMGATLA